MGLRERNREQVKRRIVDVAYRLFAERGYDATNVDDIAAESGVSPRTFYRYFASKDATLAISGFRSVDTVLETVRPDATISELVVGLLEAMTSSFGQAYVEVVVPLLREHPLIPKRVPCWRHAWSTHLAEGLARAAGRIEPNADDRVRAVVAMTVAGLAADEWVRGGSDVPLVELAAANLNVVATHLGG